MQENKLRSDEIVVGSKSITTYIASVVICFQDNKQISLSAKEFNEKKLERIAEMFCNISNITISSKRREKLDTG